MGPQCGHDEGDEQFETKKRKAKKMAIEQKRGCGYRKVGGLYMVTGGLSATCDRLPVEAKVCPCCGEGIKQGLGWKWVEPFRMFEGKHSPADDAMKADESNSLDNLRICDCQPGCWVCNPVEGAKAGLMWVGTKFYPTPEDFLKEGVEMGISKRIKCIPNGFEMGKTRVLLAHPKAIKKNVSINSVEDPELKADMEAKGEKFRVIYSPGIFAVFMPEKIEQLVQEKKATKAAMKKLEKRGITPVVVPDSDPDHFGSAHDSKKKVKKLANTMAKKKS